jgi:hypothetical protein
VKERRRLEGTKTARYCKEFECHPCNGHLDSLENDLKPRRCAKDFPLRMNTFHLRCKKAWSLQEFPMD